MVYGQESTQFSEASGISSLMPYMHDNPRFFAYQIKNSGEPGDFDGAQGINLDLYRIGTKANNKDGTYYVVYDSLYAVVQR